MRTCSGLQIATVNRATVVLLNAEYANVLTAFHSTLYHYQETML